MNKHARCRHDEFIVTFLFTDEQNTLKYLTERLHMKINKKLEKCWRGRVFAADENNLFVYNLYTRQIESYVTLNKKRADAWQLQNGNFFRPLDSGKSVESDS